MITPLGHTHVIAVADYDNIIVFSGEIFLMVCIDAAVTHDHHIPMDFAQQGIKTQYNNKNIKLQTYMGMNIWTQFKKYDLEHMEPYFLVYSAPASADI